MKFSESGLPNNKLIEEAFNYSLQNALSYEKEGLENFNEQITEGYEMELEALKAAKDAGELDEQQYNMERKKLDFIFDQQKKMGPSLVARELRNMFKGRRVAAALEASNNSEGASPEIVAALLLVEAVRSPKDFLAVQAKFGPAVAGVISELHHAEAYPVDREDILSAADRGVKRAYMAILVNTLEQIVVQFKQIQKLDPSHRISFAAGQEEILAGNAQSVWGNDAKLDKRFVDAFNNAAGVAKSPYHAEINGGKLEMVKGGKPPAGPSKPKPGKPSGPGGAGGIGDDVF